MQVLTKYVFAAALSLVVSSGTAWAAGEAHEPEPQDWSFNGFFGAFDKAQLQRGFQIYSQVCSGCHSLKFVAYRHLEGLGYNEAEIKAIAAETQVEGGPDDSGDMFMRPGVPADFITGPYDNENQARAFNGGALPPDLSLITKARHGGPDYIYALLTGYESAPESFELATGMNYNSFFLGSQIAMFSPLADGVVEYADGTPANVEQLAADVTAFLTWAGEPRLEDRKRIGFKVVIFLLILSGLLYAAKRRVWSTLH